MAEWKLNGELFSLLYPVSHIGIYPGGYVIYRYSVDQSGTFGGGGTRGQVEYLSRRSLSRLALTAMSVKPGLLISLLTLTYGPAWPPNGKKVKYHLRCVLQWLNRKFGRYSYLWFLEFQGRGAPHLHVLTSIRVNDERRIMLAKYWTKLQRVGDWPYCRLRDKKLFHVKQSVLDVNKHPRTWDVVRSEDGAGRYAVKYATKVEQKIVPEFYQDVGRFWGSSSDLTLGMPERIIQTSEKDLREWMVDVGHQVADWEVLPKVVLRFDKW